MVMSKLLLEYKGELLVDLIEKPLKNLLLAAAKYNTLPIGIIQFLVSKINLQPVMALTIYDDKKLLSALCKPSSSLDATMVNSLPDVANPTVIIFPTEIDSNDIIYNYSQRYYYSSAYLIDLKTGINTEDIWRYAIYTSNNRGQVMCNLELLNQTGIYKLPELPMSIKLPFRKIIKVNPLYEPIIESFIKNKALIIPKTKIEELFNIIKENQTYLYEGIQLYKDFIKQKPNSLLIYTALDESTDIPIRSVCLKMDYNSKLTHIVFYRYMEGIV